MAVVSTWVPPGPRISYSSVSRSVLSASVSRLSDSSSSDCSTCMAVFRRCMSNPVPCCADTDAKLGLPGRRRVRDAGTTSLVYCSSRVGVVTSVWMAPSPATSHTREMPRVRARVTQRARDGSVLPSRQLRTTPSEKPHMRAISVALPTRWISSLMRSEKVPWELGCAGYWVVIGVAMVWWSRGNDGLGVISKELRKHASKLMARYCGTARIS